MSVWKGKEFVALQAYVWDYPSFPTLFIPHFILMCIFLRTTIGENWRNFSRAHPLSCYLMAIPYCFSGGIITTMLLAKPVLSFLLNTPLVITMTVSWYLVFYAPGDFLVGLIGRLRLQIPMQMMQDFLRMQLVLSGVETIHKLHPSAIIYPIVFALCSSSGFMFFKYAEGVFLQGFDRAFVIPHHSTTTCILASAVFTFQILGYVTMELKPLFTLFVLLSLSMRLLAAFTDWDPYVGFQKIFCAALFGVEDYSRKSEVKSRKTNESKSKQTE